MLELFKTEQELAKHLVNHGDLVGHIVYEPYEEVTSQYPLDNIVRIGCCEGLILSHRHYEQLAPKQATLVVFRIMAQITIEHF